MVFILANLPSLILQGVVLHGLVHGMGAEEKIALVLTLGMTVPLSFMLVSSGMLKVQKNRVNAK